jgi:hypothetical protein
MWNVTTAMHFTLMGKSSQHQPKTTRSLECVASKARSNYHFFLSHHQPFVIFFVDVVLSLLIFSSASASSILLWPLLLWESKLTIPLLVPQDLTLFVFMESYVIAWEVCC